MREKKEKGASCKTSRLWKLLITNFAGKKWKTFNEIPKGKWDYISVSAHISPDKGDSVKIYPSVNNHFSVCIKKEKVEKREKFFH